MLVDSHAHLLFDDYKGETAEVLTRAWEAGVGAVVNVGTGLDDSRAALDLAERENRIFAAVGIHPHDVQKMNDQDLAELKKLTVSKRVVAIGEVGLDYHYENSPKEIQQDRLRDFIGLAKRVQRPLILHCRDASPEQGRGAFDDCFRILDEEKGWEAGGVFHCYMGDLATAQRIITKGFYVSFSGIVTFKKAASLQEAARELPIDRILIETDAPFLSPEPHRGKRNEPAYVALVARKIAELRGVTSEEIAEATSQNTCRLFGIRSCDTCK